MSMFGLRQKTCSLLLLLTAFQMLLF